MCYNGISKTDEDTIHIIKNSSYVHKLTFFITCILKEHVAIYL